MTLEIESTSYENTFELAEKIGSRLKGGEVIELVSDVGGGKTVFVRGLASGAKSKDQVSSPSFTISSQYDALDFSIYHFDFYRLEESGYVGQELSEHVGYSDAVVVVEWGGVAKDLLPKDRLRVEISPKAHESARDIIVTSGDKHQHLIEGLK